MKFTKTLIASLMLGTSFSAMADTGFVSYATPGTALGPGTNYAIISPRSQNGGEPTLTYLNVSSLTAAATPATLVSYISTNQITAAQTNNGVTNYLAATSAGTSGTNGFTPGGWVVIQHLGLMPRFQLEAAIIAGIDSSNHLLLAASPVNPVLVGDVINQQTSWASIPLVSSATTPTSIVGDGIITGQRNEPFLMVVSSTAASTNVINAVNAVYK